MERTDEVEVGDLLVTSGVGRAFPRGVPVARVSKVVKRDFGMYQAVEAIPTVDFSRLEEVLIITSPPYWTAVEYDGGKSPWHSYGQYLADMQTVWGQCARVLRPSGRLIVVGALLRLGHRHQPGGEPVRPRVDGPARRRAC